MRDVSQAVVRQRTKIGYQTLSTEERAYECQHYTTLVAQAEV